MNRIAIIAAAIAASASFAAIPAAAEDIAVPIYFGDLDTSSKDGVKTLGERVKTGVNRACSRPDTRDFKANRAWEECKDAALTQATRQLAQQGLPITITG